MSHAGNPTVQHLELHLNKDAGLLAAGAPSGPQTATIMYSTLSARPAATHSSWRHGWNGKDAAVAAAVVEIPDALARPFAEACMAALRSTEEVAHAAE